MPKKHKTQDTVNKPSPWPSLAIIINDNCNAQRCKWTCSQEQQVSCKKQHSQQSAFVHALPQSKEQTNTRSVVLCQITSNIYSTTEDDLQHNLTHVISCVFLLKSNQAWRSLLLHLFHRWTVRIWKHCRNGQVINPPKNPRVQPIFKQSSPPILHQNCTLKINQGWLLTSIATAPQKLQGWHTAH